MTGLIIGGCILFWLIVVILWLVFNVSDNNSRIDKVNNAIEKEIRNFLFKENDVNYIFKDSNLYQQMKSEIRTAIIDLRYNKSTLNKSYISGSETKIKQIHRIINKYYKLDKKNIIEIESEEVNNDVILIENKEIDVE